MKQLRECVQPTLLHSFHFVPHGIPPPPDIFRAIVLMKGTLTPYTSGLGRTCPVAMHAAPWLRHRPAGGAGVGGPTMTEGGSCGGSWGIKGEVFDEHSLNPSLTKHITYNNSTAFGRPVANIFVLAKILFDEAKPSGCVSYIVKIVGVVRSRTGEKCCLCPLCYDYRLIIFTVPESLMF